MRVLLAPDAKHWKKRWPIYHWETLLELLPTLPQHVEFTLVGSTASLNQELAQKFAQNASGRVRNLLGNTELSQLPALAAEHTLCLASNSAWLHLAEAVGCPVITLAGPIVPGFGFSPWQKNSVELYVPLTCRPCTRHGGGFCLRKGSMFHACMKQITPQKVFSEIQNALVHTQ